ncbi:fibronectin type III domain-containing protein [Bacteroides sp. AN502(2024)]|uniref:fibronectin type III domain-containing protein n=1 Tax=Bacteroides sp. AN502(2024) TaxID=3160599 RepID=UPI003515E3DB
MKKKMIYQLLLVVTVHVAASLPAAAQEAPRDLRVTAHQGELEISWAKPQNVEGVTWEVVLNDGPGVSVSTPSYICTKLRPGTVYRIQVRALRGSEQSPYTEQRVSTKRMERPEHSEDRIPYLRTLLPDGTSPGRFLDLYYNELANPEAAITYRIDGRPVVPVNNRLEFPAFTEFNKNFQLEICIDEGGGREWEILYNELNVRNIDNH